MATTQGGLAWLVDAAQGEALVGDRSLRKRMAPIADNARIIRRLAQEIVADGAGLVRDLVHERPTIVFSIVGVATLLLARFVSVRTLATAATLGAQVGDLVADG
jgi:hypothetical protein